MVWAVWLCVVLAAAGLCGAAAEGNAAGEAPELLIENVREATDEELEAARQAILREQYARLTPYLLLDRETLEIPMGKEAAITATVEDLREELECGPFEWKSSDESVATVKNGTVRPAGAGETEITCTAEVSDGTRLAASCRVTVYIRVAKIAAENKWLDITRGQTEQISAVITPEDATDPSVSYESSDPSVATVSESGLVTGISPGAFSILISAKDDSGQTCIVKGNILQNTESVALEFEEANVPVGRKVHIGADVYPGDARNRNLIWTSSDESVAAVNAQGLVTAIAVGTATIHAEAADGSGAGADCRITAVDPVRSVKLSEKSLQLIAGMEYRLEAEVLPEDATIRTLAWSSSDEQVASVDGEGRITPVAEGTCMITAETTDGSGVKAQLEATVKEYDIIFSGPDPVTVTYEPLTISGMITSECRVSSGVVNAESTKGEVTIIPLAEGEDTVTVSERERMSGKSVSETWKIIVLPGALGE